MLDLHKTIIAVQCKCCLDPFLRGSSAARTVKYIKSKTQLFIPFYIHALCYVTGNALHFASFKYDGQYDDSIVMQNLKGASQLSLPSLLHLCQHHENMPGLTYQKMKHLAKPIALTEAILDHWRASCLPDRWASPARISRTNPLANSQLILEWATNTNYVTEIV